MNLLMPGAGECILCIVLHVCVFKKERDTCECAGVSCGREIVRAKSHSEKCKRIILIF